MIDHRLFITGAQRSGTTLLGRLFDQIPDVSLLSQPFPMLFVSAKRAFLQSLGMDGGRYPLGHLFQENRYHRGEIAEFLRRWRPSREELAALFAEMEGYSGQYTRFAPDRVRASLAGLEDNSDFASVVAHLVGELSDRLHCGWKGSKETTCEEFLPPLLDRGFRCILIIRDPRDIIASLNHGRGMEFGGALKPTLFNIRSWRKSVAYALTLQEHPRFRWCRFEDLARDPNRELQALTEAFGLAAPPPELSERLLEADGSSWRGNSSHGELRGISDAPIGASRAVLDPQTLRMIEAACLPELRYLRYETALSHEEAVETLRSITEPYPITRTGMESDAADSINAEREVSRLARVVDSPSGESPRWFLFEKAHARLREGYRA